MARDRLTLGLMGLDELHLRVLSTSSDNPKERANAIKGVFAPVYRQTPPQHPLVVLNLLNRGRHWVLVVLLLGNVVSP